MPFKHHVCHEPITPTVGPPKCHWCGTLFYSLDDYDTADECPSRPSHSLSSETRLHQKLDYIISLLEHSVFSLGQDGSLKQETPGVPAFLSSQAAPRHMGICMKGCLEGYFCERTLGHIGPHQADHAEGTHVWG